MYLPLAIFCITYVLIIARRLHWLPIGRPAGAMVGACLMVASRVLTPEQAYASIDHGTLGLLFGMMLINAHLERAGAFHRAASVLEHWPRSPRALMCSIAVGSGVGSALLVNDAVCLMGTPVVMAVARDRKLRPLPLLLALAVGSNVGGVMTLTGTPQCMIVGRLGKIPYTEYAAAMVPVGLVGLVMLCAVLLVVFPRIEHETVRDSVAKELDTFDPSLLRPSVLAVVFVTVGFALHMDLAWTALSGAVLLLLMARRDASHVIERIDWSVMLFFTGLFVVVGGVRASGVMELAIERWGHLIRGGTSAVIPMSLASVVGSNVVSNVPFVLLAGPWIEQLPEARLMWLTLAMASTFAGNLTLLGSVANVIVAEGAGDAGEMTFMNYLRVGLPTTILTTVAGGMVLIGMR
jgi:Na+/H+ antiporter NhaD/arsenite permease-like protein